METIFDHQPTKEELRYLSSVDESAYRTMVTLDEALTGLTMLFAIRSDSARADYYMDQISDRQFVDFTLNNGDLRVPSAASKAGSGSFKRSKAA